MDNEKVNAACKTLLRSSFDQAALTDFLGEIGAGVGADRAYVFENEDAPDGSVLSHQRYEWNSGTAEPQIDNPELQGLVMSELLPHWLDHFRAGDPFFGVVRELTPQDQEILSPQDILSILVCPINVRGELWGFVGFDDCTREREWAWEDRQVLSHASTALAAALRHRDLALRLSTSRDALKQAIGASGG